MIFTPAPPLVPIFSSTPDPPQVLPFTPSEPGSFLPPPEQELPPDEFTSAPPLILIFSSTPDPPQVLPFTPSEPGSFLPPLSFELPGHFDSPPFKN
ncbi:hypothetical protein ACOSQ3_022005 [Xanthoceras sorbifolium]